MKAYNWRFFHSDSLQQLLIAYCCILLSTAFLQGCAAPIRKPVPEELVKTVQLLELDSIRSFIEPGETLHLNFFSGSLGPVLEKYSQSGNVLTLLALSGGGDSGAYGAGFLNGWTAAGNRPQFDIVTGISTGALMSPFAFLGSGSDEQLKAVYTGISAKNIYEVRGLREMMAIRDAIANSSPLAQLLEKYVTIETIKQIGMEHKKGRRLFVGSTHLDSGRLVVWDMGAIALSGHPEAPQLFRDIMLASASIPIAFPPVYISIEEEGKRYDEMHVDGGLINQVFGIETLAHLMSKRKETVGTIKARVYMIRNSEITTSYQQVPKRIIAIAGRTVDIMINSQSIGDIFRNYVVARSAGVEFFLTGIPDDFEKESPEAFDTGYMNALFEVGYKKGNSTDQWETAPPGLQEIMTTQ